MYVCMYTCMHEGLVATDGVSTYSSLQLPNDDITGLSLQHSCCLFNQLIGDFPCIDWLCPPPKTRPPSSTMPPSMEEVPHGVTAIRPPRGGGRYIRKRQREQERYMYKNSYLHTYYICTYVRSVQSGLSGVALFKGFTHTTMISPPSTLHY